MWINHSRIFLWCIIWLIFPQKLVTSLALSHLLLQVSIRRGCHEWIYFCPWASRRGCFCIILPCFYLRPGYRWFPCLQVCTCNSFFVRSPTSEIGRELLQGWKFLDHNAFSKCSVMATIFKTPHRRLLWVERLIPWEIERKFKKIWTGWKTTKRNLTGIRAKLYTEGRGGNQKAQLHDGGYSAHQ